eukprot:2118338-Prymnesium_polylepis.1
MQAIATRRQSVLLAPGAVNEGRVSLTCTQPNPFTLPTTSNLLPQGSQVHTYEQCQCGLLSAVTPTSTLHPSVTRARATLLGPRAPVHDASRAAGLSGATEHGILAVPAAWRTGHAPPRGAKMSLQPRSRAPDTLSSALPAGSARRPSTTIPHIALPATPNSHTSRIARDSES